jgi:hypothetical protein
VAGDFAMPKMYEEFAEWWPLLSAPADYEEEAACSHEIFVARKSTR